MWLTPASVCIVDWTAAAPAEGADDSAPMGVLRLFNGGPDLVALTQAFR
jgi:hypothetical protein